LSLGLLLLSISLADADCLAGTGLHSAQSHMLTAPSTMRPAALPAEEVHVLPQLCVVHPVPAALWRPLGTLPALMWQLEGALLADQLLEQLLPADLAPDK
jgi:hypothetical protein